MPPQQNHKPVPVYQTLSPRMLISSGDRKWQSHFPFDQKSGFWGFCGRVTLFHGIKYLNLPANSKILVPQYFQGTEIDSLLAAGYRLVYYRIDDKLEANIEDIESRIDSDVSVLYVIHYFGFPQDLDSLSALAKKHNLKLIEDCALSLYSKYKDKWLGSYGDLSFFSVYKTIALPHGGFGILRNQDAPSLSLEAPSKMSVMVQTKDLVFKYLASSPFSFIESGMKVLSRIVRLMIGWNRTETVRSGIAIWDERLVSIGANDLVKQYMGQYSPEIIIARRRENYLQLHSLLESHFDTLYPILPEGVCPLFYSIIVEDRDKWHKRLKDYKIGTTTLWLPSHPSCPEELGNEVQHLREKVLELPIHQSIRKKDIEYLAESLIEIKEEFSVN